MPFTNSNDHLTGRRPVPFPSGSEVLAVRFKVSLAAGDLTLNNVGHVGVLPAGCVPVGINIDSDDLDTNGTPALAWSFGLSNATVANNVQPATGTDISTATADGGAAWVTGNQDSRTGVASANFTKAMSRVTPTTYDRYLLAKATTAAATAAAGELGVTLLYRAALST